MSPEFRTGWTRKQRRDSAPRVVVSCATGRGTWKEIALPVEEEVAHQRYLSHGQLLRRHKWNIKRMMILTTRWLPKREMKLLMLSSVRRVFEKFWASSCI
jgi:hypothetical protein